MLGCLSITTLLLGATPVVISTPRPAAQGQSAPRPVHVQSWHINSPSGDTIEQRLEETPVVVVGTVVSGPTTRAVDLRPDLERRNPGAVLIDPIEVPVTDYVLQVTEVLRGPASIAIGAPLQVAQIGGRVAFPTRDIVVKSRIATLTAGSRYLALLEYNEAFETYIFAVEDLFRLDSPRVRLDSLSSRPAYAEQLEGKGAEDILDRVRAAIKTRAAQIQ